MRTKKAGPLWGPCHSESEEIRMHCEFKYVPSDQADPKNQAPTHGGGS